MKTSSEEEPPRVLFVVTTRNLGAITLAAVILVLSFFVLHTYGQIYDAKFGWSKMILFGVTWANRTLPRLQRVPHYEEASKGANTGYDGQFYAQMAIDPSLRDPAFPKALDLPAYRGRRIGLSAVSFCLGGMKPRRIVQAYALSNLFFWFVLLAALVTLLKPWTGQQLLCLSAAMLGFGVVISMERSLTDLPATALLFAGTAIGSWGGYAAFAAAGLTRETSLLAAVGFLDPWRPADWKRSLGKLGVAMVPLVLWILYVSHRFGPDQSATGSGNFTFPLQAMIARFVHGIRLCMSYDHGGSIAGLRWLYYDNDIHEVLAVAAIFFQGLYLVLRRDLRSPFWRTGVCYVILAALLGEAVWDQTAAAARVLLPMTVCFYLRVSRERPGWFWPFFVLGSLAVPWSVYDFWTMT